MMARDELRPEDMHQLAKAFGFDDVTEFEGFVDAEQKKSDFRQRYLTD